MTFFNELKTFLKHILDWVYSFVFFCFFLFSFGLEKVQFSGYNYWLLLPSDNSLSIQFFNKMRHDLLSPDIQIIVTNPMSAFVSQVSIAMFLSFILTAPLFIYKMILYLSPALHPHERKVVAWLLWPLISLFLIGSVFSYYFLIPKTFDVLYPYATSIGATPYFSLDEFTFYVTSLTIGVGLMFLLPLLMILLSFVGIINARFWKDKWRYSLLLFLILSAIITPDGTGITMAMLFIPLALLYFFGYFFANKFSKRKIVKKRSKFKLQKN